MTGLGQGNQKEKYSNNSDGAGSTQCGFGDPIPEISAFSDIWVAAGFFGTMIGFTGCIHMYVPPK